MNEAPASVGNALSIHALAVAALTILARDGAKRASDGWRVQFTGASGIPVTISCAGPDLPARIARDLAPPALIPTQRPWVGKYRLIVTAPLIVLDLCWTPNEPVRIMGFSRGDWEKDLLATGR